MSSTPISVYLAHPIDQAKDGKWSTVPDYLRRTLAREGIPVYSPSQAWTINPTTTQPSSAVQAINNEALRRATHVVVVVPAGVASIGTSYELAQAIHDPAITAQVVLVYEDTLLESSWMLPWISERVQLSIPFDSHEDYPLRTEDMLALWQLIGVRTRPREPQPEDDDMVDLQPEDAEPDSDDDSHYRFCY